MDEKEKKPAVVADGYKIEEDVGKVIRKSFELSQEEKEQTKKKEKL